MENSLIKQSFIHHKLKIKDFSELVQVLSQKMLTEEFILESYAQAVIDRESISPTGLKTQSLGIAIPHTESIHVKKSAISVVTLEEPIKMKSMLDPEESIEVSIIFLLAINNPHGQVETLRKLMGIFQNQDLLKAIYQTESQNALFQLLVDKI